MDEIDREIEEQKAPIAYVGRVGILFFALPARDHGHTSVPTPNEFYDQLVAQLTSDARVKELRAPSSGENELRPESFSAAGWRQGRTDGKPDGPHLHIHVASFRTPILMAINVPQRLQPQDRGERGIPAEEYWVAWDGVQLLVLWDRNATEHSLGYYGGFAAMEIISDALDELGLSPRNQPCGPYCKYPFAHQDLLVAPAADTSKVRLREEGRFTVRIDCPSEPDVLELAHRLSRSFSLTVNTFAKMRSFGDSVSGTEIKARRELADLLQHQYEIARTAAEPFIRSIRLRWKNRGLRRKMSKGVARLWMHLATIERNQRHCIEGRYIYDTSAQRQGIGLIFKTEYPQFLNSIDTLEIDTLRATVEQLSMRVDTRIIAVATIAGAMSGALVGALVTLLRPSGAA
ncbi:hypothetical protein [Agromyces sp. CCNWLW203]|uniref:hypothetical protein n=1 Tax=Agromyces sp. CCNWLW203 TaxID=3112842 RepID=UPI002F968E7F